MEENLSWATTGNWIKDTLQNYRRLVFLPTAQFRLIFPQNHISEIFQVRKHWR